MTGELASWHFAPSAFFVEAEEPSEAWRRMPMTLLPKTKKNSKSYPHIRLFYFAVENHEWGIKLKVLMRGGVLRRDFCRNTTLAEMAAEELGTALAAVNVEAEISV